MPLNDHEQKILEEIERRLSEEDPRLVEQVTRTDLHTHAWGRMKLAIAGFVVGSLMLLLVGVSVWIAAGGVRRDDPVRGARLPLRRPSR